MHLQGIQTRYDILWGPRWPTKVDFQVQKKVAAHSGDRDIWVLSICFQKSNIGWPQQPLTEKVTIFNLIFYDSTNIFFSLKHQINVKFFIELLNPRTLKNSVVIFKTLDTFTASLTSAASAASMASATSKALFHQKTSWSWWFHPPWHQNYQNWSLFLDWIIKSPDFY